MRAHFLPAEQQKRNDSAIEKLRRIGYVLFVLLLAALGLGAKLYLSPPNYQSGTQLTSDDGKTIYSDAIVVAPDLVLSPAKITGSAEFVAPSERIRAKRINSTVLSDGTEITLFRLDNLTTIAPVAITVIEVGDPLAASGAGQEWHGAARIKRADGYSVEPEFTLSSGTAVYRESDKTSLVGFGVHTGSGEVILPAKDVLGRFPELNVGH
jgi:hypothetical protein